MLNLLSLYIMQLMSVKIFKYSCQDESKKNDDTVKNNKMKNVKCDFI